MFLRHPVPQKRFVGPRNTSSAPVEVIPHLEFYITDQCCKPKPCCCFTKQWNTRRRKSSQSAVCTGQCVFNTLYLQMQCSALYYIAFALHLHCICIVLALYLHCICIVFADAVQCIVFALHLHCICIVFALY